MSEAKILIADDGKVMRVVLAASLKKNGYEVVEAENGQEAVDRLREHGDFDLVVLDIQMPELDGISALKEIRKSHSRVELPVIMATANDQEEDVVQAFELGANDFISKPINFPILKVRVETHIQLKRASEELARKGGNSTG
ncbi:MAG: response regulator [Verrucomicrobiales bacterium]|nr:response regulator [Verrucomicrobiales bacterium]